MIIFISNIPEDTRPSELFSFVNPALKIWWFFRSGKIQKAEILYIQDKINATSECHGLVHVNSTTAGLMAVARLNGKRFKNQKVLVREYFKRNSQNDRRLEQMHLPAAVLEKRQHQRRRGDNVDFIKDSYNFFVPQ